MDRIYKIVITGHVIQKDYMDEPNTWDWTPVRWDDFITTPDITCTELVEAVSVRKKGLRMFPSQEVERTND